MCHSFQFWPLIHLLLTKPVGIINPFCRWGNGSRARLSSFPEITIHHNFFIGAICWDLFQFRLWPFLSTSLMLSTVLALAVAGSYLAISHPRGFVMHFPVRFFPPHVFSCLTLHPPSKTKFKSWHVFKRKGFLLCAPVAELKKKKWCWASMAFVVFYLLILHYTHCFFGLPPWQAEAELNDLCFYYQNLDKYLSV